ncbi:MAG: biotin/lipoyl-containing protein [Gemmatimonadota bacterium]
MKYFVALNGREREVELTEEGVRVDGQALHAELARIAGGPELHLKLGSRGFSLSAVRTEDGWDVEVYGRRIRTSVEDERARAIRELAGLALAEAGPRELRAPMPGLVLKVFVEPGHRVEAGDPLVVVEAMKMENELRAEAGGTVASVPVEEGGTVSQNDLLVTFE